jgi:hypothetical protein
MLVRFNGLNLADESKFVITGIDGWDDMPDIVSGSAVRPRRHGSWPGGVLATKRVVSLDVLILPGQDGTVTANLLALRKAMALTEKEHPLTMDLDYDLGEEEINARVTSLLLPVSAGYGSRRMAHIEFTASDPRRYKALWFSKAFGTRTRSVVPSYPIKYPKGYTQYGKPGDLTVVNDGFIDTPPMLRIRGPIQTPSITITDTQGVRKMTFDAYVAAGRELVVDVQNGTAKQGSTSFYGDTRGALLEDMSLRPGVSTIHFAGTGNSSQNARLHVEWRSASL